MSYISATVSMQLAYNIHMWRGKRRGRVKRCVWNNNNNNRGRVVISGTRLRRTDLIWDGACACARPKVAGGEGRVVVDGRRKRQQRRRIGNAHAPHGIDLYRRLFRLAFRRDSVPSTSRRVHRHHRRRLRVRRHNPDDDFSTPFFRPLALSLPNPVRVNRAWCPFDRCKTRAAAVHPFALRDGCRREEYRTVVVRTVVSRIQISMFRCISSTPLSGLPPFSTDLWR